jgi:hypothetical protein
MGFSQKMAFRARAAASICAAWAPVGDDDHGLHRRVEDRLPAVCDSRAQ